MKSLSSRSYAGNLSMNGLNGENKLAFGEHFNDNGTKERTYASSINRAEATLR